MSYKNKANKVKKKVKTIGNYSHSLVSIALSHNNVHVTLSDLEGNVLCWSSSGTVGMKNNKKSTPFAAKSVGRDMSSKAYKLGVKSVEIRVKGFSNNLDEVVRGIASQIRVDGIKDVTPIAFNGTRPRGARRV